MFMIQEIYCEVILAVLFCGLSLFFLDFLFCKIVAKKLLLFILLFHLPILVSQTAVGDFCAE